MCLISLFRCVNFCGIESCVSSKFIFFPPKSTYKMDEKGEHFYLKNKFGIRMDEQFFFKRIRISKKIWIASVFIKNPKADYCLVYFHGNAIDLGDSLNCIVDLSNKLNVSVFAYDYRGYGESNGKSNIKNIYTDSELVINDFIVEHSVDPKKIILYGHSLGTVLAIHLAGKEFGPQNQKMLAVVLLSGFTSALKIVDPTYKDGDPDIMPNYEAIKKVISPIFIIHGEKDDLIPVHHAKILSERAPNLYESWIMENAGHNDIETKYRDPFVQKLQKFINSLQ